MNGDQETADASSLMLQFLTETKKTKAQKQATKSVCLLLQNKRIEKMPAFLIKLKEFTHETFFTNSFNL